MQDLFTYQNNFLNDFINYYVVSVENYNNWSSWEDAYHVIAFFDDRLPSFFILNNKEQDYLIDNLNSRMPHKPHRHMNRNRCNKLITYLLKRDLEMDYKLNK